MVPADGTHGGEEGADNPVRWLHLEPDFISFFDLYILDHGASSEWLPVFVDIPGAGRYSRLVVELNGLKQASRANRQTEQTEQQRYPDSNPPLVLSVAADP